jgi:hypothetical protein
MERGSDLSNIQKNSFSSKGKNYLFVIGIDQYQHWPVLQNAVRDAKDIIKVLTNQYQFEEEDVVSLFDEQANEANIYQAIRELKRRIEPEDNLLVYYSGHGHYDQDFDEGHWVPVDAQTQSEDRYISNANIIKRINAIDAHHIFMVVDSCFSGSLVVANRNFTVDEHYRSRRIFSSGRLEAVSDGAPGENSPFASLLLTRLKRNTEKAVTTTDLVQYVKKTIAGRSQQAPVDGRIQNSKDEGGEFIFHLKISEEGLWQRVQKENTATAYEHYLSDFPEGQFAPSARRRLLAMKEDEVWKSAQTKDNETAYKDYLQKYAGTGKYLDEAQTRLDNLGEKFRARRSMLENLAKKDAERSEIQRKFNELIDLAEKQFSAKKLEDARDAYRESLQYFMQGFAPSYDYIEQQINFCTNGMTFLNHYQNGRDAMDKDNFRLAIQYFLEAQKISDDPKIDDLIKVCKQRMKRPARKKTTPVAHGAAAPPRKRKYTWIWITLGVAVGLFFLLGVIGLMMEETGIDYPVEGMETISSSELVGSWQVTDIQDANGYTVINNAYYSSYHPIVNGIFTFKSDNTLEINLLNGGQEFQQYSLTGNALQTRNDFSFSNGIVNYVDQTQMQVTFNIADGAGGSYLMTYYFTKVN